MTIILASQSPRRQELLKRVIPVFDIEVADINEEVPKGMSPIEYVKKMAMEKAQFIHEKQESAMVIGCDTIVTIDEEIIGKPISKDHAFQILRKLSGRTHTVYTAVTIIRKDHSSSLLVPAEVTFYDLSDEEIYCYLATGEYKDKAGAYGIQEQGALLVKEIKGDYYSIMGLPIAELSRHLAKKFGVQLTEEKVKR